VNRIVLVGEMNPYGSDPRYALFCAPEYSAGGRMQRLVLGLKRHRYLEIPRYNLCTGRWSMPQAREAAQAILNRHSDGHDDIIVALGAKVAGAFGLKYDVCKLFFFGAHGRVLVLPHPSGLNRMWNDPELVGRCRKALVDAGSDLPFGEVTS